MPNYAKTWTLGGRDEFQAGIVFTQTNKDPEKCTSNIYFALYLITTENDADEEYTYSVTVNGQTFSGTKDMELGKNTYGLIVNGNVTLSHPADGGAATFNYSVSLDAKGLFFGHAYLNASDSYTFSGFSRKATMSFVNAFTDEENISIGYNNPAKTAATLEVGISLDGTTTPAIIFRSVSNTSGLQTINLVESERNILRAANKTGTTATATIILKCYVGGSTYYDTMDKEYSIINVTPTLSPSVKDVDTRTKALTGNDQKFILGFSDAQFDTGARAVKQATIDYQWIRCGSTTLDDYTQNTGTISNVDSNTFYFEMKNSRGLTVNSFKVLDLVPYVKLTSRLETSLFRADGTVDFTIKGKYFNDTFGKEYNTMQVQYSLQDEDGNFAQVTGVRESGWVELGVVQPSITNTNNYTYSHTIRGLDYTKTWILTVAVQDALTPLQTTTTVVAPLPIFDWSGEDFHHHTDLKLMNNAKLYIDDEQVVDYVIEEGDDNLYAYRKWHSGLLEAWRKTNNTVNSVAITKTYGSMYYSQDLSLTVSGNAAQFISVEDVQLTINKGSNSGLMQPVLISTSVSGGSVTVNYLVTNPSSLNTTIIPKVRIIGRWK